MVVFLVFVLRSMLFHLLSKCNHSQWAECNNTMYFKTESSRAIIRKDEIPLVEKCYLQFTDNYL